MSKSQNLLRNELWNWYLPKYFNWNIPLCCQQILKYLIFDENENEKNKENKTCNNWEIKKLLILNILNELSQETINNQNFDYSSLCIYLFMYVLT